MGTGSQCRLHLDGGRTANQQSKTPRCGTCTAGASAASTVEHTERNIPDLVRTEISVLAQNTTRSGLEIAGLEKLANIAHGRTLPPRTGTNSAGNQ